MKVTQPIVKAKKVEPVDPSFTAVQYKEGMKELPKGVFLKKVEDVTLTVDETGNRVEEKTEVEKAFVATKDPHGDYNIEGAYSSVADGCYILTDTETGAISIVHPSVFEKEFKVEDK